MAKQTKSNYFLKANIVKVFLVAKPYLYVQFDILLHVFWSYVPLYLMLTVVYHWYKSDLRQGPGHIPGVLML